MTSDLPSTPIRKAAAHLQATEDPELRAVGAGLSRYVEEAPAGVTFEQAVGLVERPNAPKWWTREARARRDTLIRRFADRFYPEGTTERRAAAVLADLLRYEAGVWRRERRSPVVADERSAAIVEILTACDVLAPDVGTRTGLPDTTRTIRRILEAGQADAGPEV
jgi:hypothetical protein